MEDASPLQWFLARGIWATVGAMFIAWGTGLDFGQVWLCSLGAMTVILSGQKA